MLCVRKGSNLISAALYMQGKHQLSASYQEEKGREGLV